MNTIKLNNTILIIVLQALLILSYSPASQGEEAPGNLRHELIFFPQADAIYRSGLAPGADEDSNDYEYVVDIFATLNYKRLRFLAEYLFAKDEKELERVQIGWQFGEGTAWVGRFHNPIGYWNANFHHGSYLETSFSRPEISNFEDDSGLLPMHLAGFLIDGVHPLSGDRGLGYAIALAAGPEFTIDALEPWDPTSPETGDRDISATVNLFYEPHIYAPTRAGFYLNYTEIPTEGIAFTDIRQISTGIYGNWESYPWRLSGSSFFVHNQMDLAGTSVDDSFFHVWLQAEYSFNPHWTLFGRVEETFADGGDAYLALHPGYVEDKVLGGVRFDFAKQHALKLEISNNQSSTEDFGLVILQWSAHF